MAFCAGAFGLWGDENEHGEKMVGEEGKERRARRPPWAEALHGLPPLLKFPPSFHLQEDFPQLLSSSTAWGKPQVSEGTQEKQRNP